MSRQKKLKVNEWIMPNQRFVYQIFWPYAERPEDSTTVDVYVQLGKGKKGKYVASYATPELLSQLFQQFKKNGEYAHGTYIPSGGNEIFVKRITHLTIERSLEDLLERGDFFRYLRKK